MARPDAKRSFLNGLPDLEPSGIGFAVVASFRDIYITTNDGIEDEVPQGMVARYLGPAQTFPNENYCEFVIWDPSRVEISIEPYNANVRQAEEIKKARTEIKDRLVVLKAAGWEGTVRSYPDQTTILSYRPLRSTASPVVGTSQSAQ